MLGKKVRVYFNLHKKTFSVQDRKTGLVILHTDKIFLTDVKYNVRQGGREKVLREKKKNVHAFIEGTICDGKSVKMPLDAVTYNPYKYDSFVIRSSEKPIYSSEKAVLFVTDKRPKTYRAM